MSILVAQRTSFDWSPEPESWRERAACLGAPLTVFFPEQGGSNRAMYDEARSYCDRCPVIAECMADAVRTGDRDGFRAGATGSSRERGMRGQCGRPVGRRAKTTTTWSVHDEAEVIDIRDGLRGVLATLRSDM